MFNVECSRWYMDGQSPAEGIVASELKTAFAGAIVRHHSSSIFISQLHDLLRLGVLSCVHENSDQVRNVD